MIEFEVFDNQADRTIVALHGWFQNTSAKGGYVNFQKMSALDVFGKVYGWNVIFANGPRRKWTILRTRKKIISLAHEIEQSTKKFPNRTLAGFSDGSTMAAYCAAYTPVYRQYIFHSGLFPDKKSREMVDNQRITIIVGSDDGYGMILRKFDEQVEYYSTKNNVIPIKVQGLKHHWAREYNYLIFEE